MMHSVGDPLRVQHSSKATSRSSTHVARSFSGRRGGQPNFGDSGLILDPTRGPPRPGRNPSQLFIPGQGNAPFRPGGPGGPPGQQIRAPGVEAPPTYNKFRPPAGFMENLDKDKDLPNLSSQDMLGRLRSNSGYWHQLANFIPLLNKMGYDSAAIDEATGLTPVIQNNWMVGATVYDSLLESGELTEDELGYFDAPGSDELLVPFRFLGVEMRVDAAKYIIKNRIGERECDVLARSMKEWERRDNEREGFSSSAGDCLAFKLLRDAYECKQTKEVLRKLYQGLDYAETASAIARMKQTISEVENPELQPARPAANLLVLRLAADELGLRPLPVLGTLDTITTVDLRTAPRARQAGPFGAFKIDNPDEVECNWVVLPQWKALGLVRTPVAITIPNCALLPAFIESCNPKTEEEKNRLTGPGLLVVESSMVGRKISTEHYYLVRDRGGMDVVSGEELDGDQPVAQVVLMCRPPMRADLDQAQGNLLQV